MKATMPFLSEPDIKRRDPLDVIRCGDRYYVWYTKVPEVLHRGHEMLAWRDVDGISSMSVWIGWGPSRFFTSPDGIHFTSIYNLKPQLAAGLYCADFELGRRGAVPWTRGQGLSRFEITWPKDDAE